MSQLCEGYHIFNVSLKAVKSDISNVPFSETKNLAISLLIGTCFSNNLSLFCFDSVFGIITNALLNSNGKI